MASPFPDILLTTTGTLSPVPIADLGYEPGFTHPTADYNLLDDHNLFEIATSNDLQSAVDDGYITLKDQYGLPITDVLLQLKEGMSILRNGVPVGAYVPSLNFMGAGVTGGATGVVSVEGLQGSQGYGQQGPQGIDGAGLQGPQGLGEAGSQGPQGLGEAGLQGPGGPQGAQGVQGIRLYDAVVAPSGGDYTSVAAAFASGAESVFVRTGTYVETADVEVPSGGMLLGEDDAVIYFNGDHSLVVDGNGGTKETTGTVTFTTDSTTVTGVGTTFTNLSPGDYIACGDGFCEIDSVTNDTSLELVDAFQGETASGEPMFACAMATSVKIENIIVVNSSGTGLFVRGCLQSVLTRLLVKDCLDGIVVEDSGALAIATSGVVNAGNVGVSFENTRASSFNGISQNNASHGVYVGTGCYTVSLAEISSSHNGGDGIHVDSGANNTLITNCVSGSNDGKGIDTEPDSTATVIGSCIVRSNGGIGVDMDGAQDLLTDTVISGGASDGVWPGVECTIASCTVADNTGNGIDCNADQDSVIYGNVVCDNGGNGIDINSTTNTGILVAVNRVYDNTGDGITIAAGAGSDNIFLVGNIVTGHTTNVNNGNSTTFRSVGYIQDESSEGNSSTTSSDWQRKLRMTTGTLPVGTYRISWYAEVAQSSISDAVGVRVQLNDSITIAEVENEPKDINDVIPVSGYGYAADISGVQNIDIDYREQRGGTAYIRRARLEIWRVS